MICNSVTSFNSIHSLRNYNFLIEKCLIVELKKFLLFIRFKDVVGTRVPLFHLYKLRCNLHK